MTSIDPADQGLLRHLGGVAAAVDPPPALLFELGRAAYGMHTLDADLIRLVEDRAGDLVGVRAATSQAQLLSFEGSSLAVELELTVEFGRVRLVGQVIPPGAGGGVVRVQTADGAQTSAPVDEVGAFTVGDLPDGLLRLHVETADGVAGTTTWVRP